MKIKNNETKLFHLILVLLVCLGCTMADDIKIVEKSDCAIDYVGSLESIEEIYQYNMKRPVSQGNDQSLKNCFTRQKLTQEKITGQNRKQIDKNSAVSCTAVEKARVNAKIDDRIRDMNEDLKST